MNFSKELSKLVTNKYFLYFIVFLSASNLLGYLIANNIGAVILFILVGMITVNFSKNMAIVLLVCIFITNLLMAHKTIKETMENMDKNEEEDKVSDINPTIKKGIDAVKNSTNTEQAKALYDSSKNNKDDPIIMPLHDTNPTDVTEVSNSETSAMSNMNKNNKNSKNRLDYASTLEEAYDNLDKMLGSDGIKQLSKDTKDLMSKQQELFKTMENMTPLLNSAQSMLKGFDMKQLSGFANLAQSFTGSK